MDINELQKIIFRYGQWVASECSGDPDHPTPTLLSFRMADRMEKQARRIAEEVFIRDMPQEDPKDLDLEAYCPECDQLVGLYSVVDLPSGTNPAHWACKAHTKDGYPCKGSSCLPAGEILHYDRHIVNLDPSEFPSSDELADEVFGGIPPFDGGPGFEDLLGGEGRS